MKNTKVFWVGAFDCAHEPYDMEKAINDECGKGWEIKDIKIVDMGKDENTTIRGWLVILEK